MKRMDKLRRAQTVNAMFGAFDIAPCYNAFNERCNELADFIETNYYEKPRSADGTPVDLCSEWYGEDGQKWHVVGYRAGGHNVIASTNTPLNHPKPLRSKWLRKTKPDTFKEIIQEAICKDPLAVLQRDIDELIRRCEELAKEGGGNND